jgi:hypothetical protein
MFPCRLDQVTDAAKRHSCQPACLKFSGRGHHDGHRGHEVGIGSQQHPVRAPMRAQKQIEAVAGNLLSLTRGTRHLFVSFGIFVVVPSSNVGVERPRGPSSFSAV